MAVLYLLKAIRQPTMLAPLAQRLAFHTTAMLQMSSSCNKKKALVFIANGYEEIELVTPVDVLRRGGVEVTIAGLKGKDAVTGVNCVKILPDEELDKACGKFDALILTGDDKAVKEMVNSERVCKRLQEQEKECKIIAAICSGPLVLKAHSIAKCKCLTSHPDCEQQLKDFYKYKCADVVVDDFLITARGPAQAMQWALTILMHLTDEANACCVAKALLVK